MRKRAATAVAAVLVTALGLGACGGSSDDATGGGDGTGAAAKGGTLTVWTVEDVAERVEAQKAILAGFTKATGTKVKLVALAEDQLTPVLTSAAAGGDLPDVIGALSLAGVNQMRTDDLLDTDAARAIVQGLGEDTFSASALRLTRAGDTQLAVPSDGWAQLLYYRKDLFAKAGLAVPDSYDAIAAAAAKLDQGDMKGIVAATAPADSFTDQTFEHVALANGCQLVDGSGKVTLDSPQCVQAFRFYGDLIRDHSVSGNQDADTTRAGYFAGKAAMVIWSSFLLDELAGLRNDAMPTCPQCKGDPTWLAKNTGVVSAIKGPDGSEPATFGEIVSWAVLKGAAPQARQLVSYMMNAGYEKWLAIAPEGKVPTRTGTSADPQKFVTAWQSMPAGVDKKAPLSDFYDRSVLDAVAKTPQTFSRWGLPQQQGELAGAVAGQFVIPKALSTVINSGTDPGQAAKQAADAARQIQDEIGS